MIRLEDVTLRVGSKIVLEDATWHLRQGAHVGVVGRNGAGKTTLLRLLAGELSPEAGQVHRRGKTSLAWLPQQAVSLSDRTLWDEVRGGMTRMRALEDALHRAEQAVAAGEPGAPAQLDRALEAWRIGGGPSADEQVGEVLHGLGFAATDRDLPCTSFSGGWRMRVALARHLLADADIRLLDEPTNHLDWPARTWLAEHLASSPASIVVVSHDRWLLERFATETVEVRRGKLHAFKGSPAAWARERALRDAHAEAVTAKLDAEAAKLERFVERFGAKATKAAAARSAERKLARLDEARPDLPDAEEAVARLKLPSAPPSSTELIALRGAAFGHEGGPSWSGVDLAVARGERWAIVGPNGAGKSTLLHALAGTQPLTAGQRVLGRDVILAMHAQDLAAALPSDETAVAHVRAEVPAMSDTRIRGALGALGLSGERALQPIGALSGGQKARVVLASFVLKPSNLLLLDEPTNHLDVPTAEALAEALEAWDGGLVVVTHDRWLVERVATHVAVVRDGEVQTWDRLAPEALERASAPVHRREGSSSGPTRTQEAPSGAAAQEARKARRRDQRRYERLQEEMEALEAELGRIDEALFAQATDVAAAQRLGAERDAVEAKLEATFEEAAALEEALSAEA